MKIITAITLALVLPAIAHGQSRQVPGAPQDAPILLLGGELHPVSSPPVADGWILIADGRISAIGSGIVPETPAETTVVDLAGRRVYPGLIAADSLLGLIETEQVDVTRDHDEYGSLTPESRVIVAMNPDSDMIPVARAAGILTAMVSPDGGRLPGQGAVVRLDGWTSEDLAIEPEAALLLEWPRSRGRGSGGAQRAADQVKELNDFFDAAERYFVAREHDPLAKPDLRYESMRAAMNHEVPILVRASTAGQIESAAGWASDRGLRIVILGGEEADRVGDLLIAQDIPVILRGTHRLPSARHEGPHHPHEVPRLLHESGVRFCIAPRDRPGSLRNLPHHAATAAAHGLPRDAALRSVTLDAAEILGVGDRLGSLEPGKSATLIITDGDPLELLTQIDAAYIDGRPVDLSSRHTELRDKYRKKYQQNGRIDQDSD